MELTERDYLILSLVFRFKFCLGRHIRVLANFSGSRASDRRLKSLCEGGYLSRKKYLYGMPYLYTLTHKGRVLLGVNKREDKIRIDKITHDIHVLDAVIFLHGKREAFQQGRRVAVFAGSYVSLCLCDKPIGVLY